MPSSRSFSQTLTRHVRGNAVGYVALFIALGGTSYAAVSLPKNSVTSKQIKAGAVTQTKLSKPVRAQLAAKAKPGPAGPAGVPGPKGEPGPVGTTGPAGSTGATGAVGATGATGAAGATGATGPDGVLDSAFASRGSLGVGLTGTVASVLALSTPAAVGLTAEGPIVTTGPARLSVNAAVELFIGNSETALGRANCSLRRVTNGASPVTIGNGREVSFEPNGGGTARFRTLGLVATSDVPAGTHDISIQCGRFDTAGPPVVDAPVSARNVDLSVVAFRQP